jgi:probable HAF family extracellular repeat protein
MKSALALVLLAATTASIGCGGGAVSVPASKPPVVQNPSPQPPPSTPSPQPPAPQPSCNPPNVLVNGACQPPPQPQPPPTQPPPTPPPVTPAKHYLVVDLVPITGANAAQANAVSSGRAAGYSVANGVARATLWENGLPPQDLGAGFANAINGLDHPVVAGYVLQPDATTHATTWADGTVSDLLTLVGYDSSIATGINDQNEVVGSAFSLQNPANQVGFRWTSQTGIQAIDGSATALAVNKNGDIAGMTQNLRAAIFTASGTTIALGTLGDFSIAVAVNDQGHAVGMSPLTPGGKVHAFFYNGTTLQDLGTIQPGSNTVATSVNDNDLVVGSSNLAGNSLAFVWSATTGMQDLNSLISKDSGWTLVTASGISQDGTIVGAGVINGAVHGFLLTPEN